MTTTADDHFPAPPTVSQYKIERSGFAHLGVHDYGFYGSFRPATGNLPGLHYQGLLVQPTCWASNPSRRAVPYYKMVITT
jgi:hypothetical protein